MTKLFPRGGVLLPIAIVIAACSSVHPAVSPAVLAPAVSDTSIFAPLRMAPAPSATRSAGGTPGPKYWQNRADYALTARLDTATGTVYGGMVLRYTNNSPQTLDVIWVQTEQNSFRRDTARASGNASARRYGDIIERFVQRVGSRSLPVQLEDHKSETKVTLAEPLKPGQTATLEAAWHFVVPSDVPRMGREGALYQIAQWYPRVNVYDDVKGWNTEPYLGGGEFFLEYGDYTLELTVPSNYIVVATGTLDNPADVLTPTQRARLAKAAVSDTVVHVATAAELTDGTAHLKRDGTATWKYHATNVRDMVFATSPDYIWDATSWKGILAQAYYRPAAAQAWTEVADMARMSIQEYSERWFPYPYPSVSVAEGTIGGGMEYPMLSFDGSFPDKHIQYMVITHEVGHNWFPMIVGSNERVHAWMDEGINTFITTFSQARRYPERDQAARGDGHERILEGRIKKQQDLRVEVPADSAPDIDYSAYYKPSGVLNMLRRDVMGPTRFDAALRDYVRRWAYKHPTPADFFRAMNVAAGRNLDWFWREWFLEVPNFDQAIDSVSRTPDGANTRVRIVYGNKGRGVLPLLVRFTFSDGTTQNLTYPADVWMTNSTRYEASYTFPGKTVTRIAIDPDKHLVDTNRANNVWEAK